MYVGMICFTKKKKKKWRKDWSISLKVTEDGDW